MVVIRIRRTGKHLRLPADLEAAWIEESARHKSQECDHNLKEPRLRRTSDGRTMIMDQCLVCGVGRGGAHAKRNFQVAPAPWDEDLPKMYESERTKRYDDLEDKYVALVLENERGLTEKTSVWHAEYQAYRRSEAWQRKRALVMLRAGGKCEGCLMAPAEVVHHLSYQNMGDELLFELVALCPACHDKAHPEHNESYYDVDYSPCKDCRMGEGNGHCGRFDQPQYLALSANGACGPKWVGFEGLK